METPDAGIAGSESLSIDGKGIVLKYRLHRLQHVVSVLPPSFLTQPIANDQAGAQLS